MNVKKAAPHRKAIAEAASLSPPNPASNMKNSTSNKATAGRTAAPGGSHNNASTADVSGAGASTAAEANDDYETSKVNKSKKATYDADIKAVEELDRWG